MTRHAAPQAQDDQGALPGLALLGGLLAVILSFFLTTLAVLLALVVIVLGVIAWIRARRARQAASPGVIAVVLGVIAILIAGAMSPDQPQETAAVAPPPVDPNALPATVVVAALQSPDNVVTTEGRRLHVTMMQGRNTTEACQTGSDAAVATRLLTGQKVSIAAPDAAHTDTPTAVPAGFQPVVMTLADGRDYAETWQTTAAESSLATCTVAEPTTTTEEPAPTTTEAPSEPDVDVDVDRPYVPAPRTKVRSGQSGHPCLPGERDGDGDGYCGE